MATRQDVLVVGDLVMFPDGAVGAHQLINQSTTVARVCAYPDSGKLSTLGGIFKLTDTVDYWDGEPGR